MALARVMVLARIMVGHQLKVRPRRGPRLLVKAYFSKHICKMFSISIYLCQTFQGIYLSNVLNIFVSDFPRNIFVKCSQYICVRRPKEADNASLWDAVLLSHPIIHQPQHTAGAVKYINHRSYIIANTPDTLQVWCPTYQIHSIANTTPTGIYGEQLQWFQ